MHQDDLLEALLRSEKGKENSSRTWLVSPVDGASGFVQGRQYTVALSLLVGGRVQLGVLGCPRTPLDMTDTSALGSLFAGVQGQGSSLLPLDEENEWELPIRVAETKETSVMTMVESTETSHTDQKLSRKVASTLGLMRNIVRMDSQAK